MVRVHAVGLRVRAGRRMAVDGIDLDLENGVHGVLGPNGAGKTTLMRALATVLRPASGELTMLGTALGSRESLRQVRERIGYLPQKFGYYKRFTVREFVEYMAWLKQMPGVDIPGAVERAVERVGLGDRADDKLSTLSGGMVRRVGIAQAIVNEPAVLLLDEPTAGLDPAERMRFRALLRESAEDTCVVVSTHLVEDVAAGCDQVLLMDKGRVLFQGGTDELAAAGESSEVGDNPLERGYSALLDRAAR
ncbi:ABC transporter ATP-binding protein [Actinokineospora globicatena]|uniref:ABC transporter ATP-binding protein n=1 Tax=Actinokineospora globicatena TaxID=103729 RepID=A0A9W6QPR4_9PSEU|nr:ABC transporter ATP-binding protein [Actinokineospora globicatena]GLW93735.1 ABC transporter ATP-binding protein [Actinokineospora globicatena]